MWLTEYYEEIATQYGITVIEAENMLRQTAEQFYTHLFRCTVVCELSGSGLIIKRYSDSGFGSREISVELRKQDIRRISAFLKTAFVSQKLKNQFALLKPYIGTAVQCVFMRYEGSKAVFYSESGLTHIQAYCTIRNTPIKEIMKYTPGQTLWFHVTGLFENLGDVAFNVTRTSKTLVNELFNIMSAKVRCIQRIPGAKSIVIVNSAIPRDSITYVARELHERITVKVMK